MKTMVSLVLVTALLAACAVDTTVSAVFRDAGELDRGHPVYLGDSRVGTVTRVTGSEGDVVVDLSLDREQAVRLRAGSAALLTRREGRPAIELYNYRLGDRPLQNGARLTGLNNAVEYAAWRASETIETGRQSMGAIAGSILAYFDSEAWERQRTESGRVLEELRDELELMLDETGRVYREFLRGLEIESDTARERAAESFTDLARRLNEHIDELRKRGDEEFIEPLQRLLEELSRSLRRTPEQQAA